MRLPSGNALEISSSDWLAASGKQTTVRLLDISTVDNLKWFQAGTVVGRRGFELRTYARVADARSPNCFAGASKIRAAPMTPNTAAAISKPSRSFGR